MVCLPILLGFASCGEPSRPFVGPEMTLVAREGVAVLEIDDDEVLFEGVPFAGTVRIFPIDMITMKGPGTILRSNGGRKLSYAFDDRGTMIVSVGEPGSAPQSLGDPRVLLVGQCQGTGSRIFQQ